MPSERNPRITGGEYEGETLMIGKMLQEVEDSTNDKERRAEIRDGRVKDWPQMLLYALWADRTTHSSVTGYMPTELMTGQAPVMPTETAIVTWTELPWKVEMSREEVLAVRIRQLEGRPADIAEASTRQPREYVSGSHRSQNRGNKGRGGNYLLTIEDE